MNGEQFKTFIDDVQEVFGMKLGRKQTDFWYKAFINVDYKVADKMIELFYNKNTSEKSTVRKPRPHDLMKLKKWAYSVIGEEEQEVEFEKCTACSSGFIIVKKFYVDMFREQEYAYRCFCQWGDSLGKMIPQLKQDTIRQEYDVVCRHPLTLRHKKAFHHGRNEMLGPVTEHKEYQDYIIKMEKIKADQMRRINKDNMKLTIGGFESRLNYNV